MQTAQTDMSNMTINDDTDSLLLYARQPEREGMDSEAEINQLYDYIMNNETYDSENQFKFNSPLLSNNVGPRNRILPQPNVSAYKPPFTREPSSPSGSSVGYAAIYFNNADDGDEPNGDDDAQFEIVSAPNYRQPNSAPAAAMSSSLNIPPPPRTAPGPPTQLVQVPLKLGPPSKVSCWFARGETFLSNHRGVRGPLLSLIYLSVCFHAGQD
jgi:hypothetical protein